ncbi:MAG: FAD-dependent monooxygenase [Sphingobium sp.]|uniref:NAD(P)/FAD-dependent oxidoreductase n=1 Tax=Sphingobium sp. TaxID=1912891 RepID=UPI0029AD9BC7|nr:FAD-dependent monooxygenase [Sphingobium sp.]MDX3909261.1 FAD-dependent monooxygenase [Sphingobium sp.]
MSPHPPLIVGGGPAGAAAGIALAQAGVQATLFERLDMPGDTICGGFLSWQTIERLAALGLDPDDLGGHRVTHMALYVGGKEQVARLPAPAMGLSRKALDTALLDYAGTSGVDVRRGHPVRSLGGTDITLHTGESVPWSSLFLATGKTDLRGMPRPHGSTHDPELGLRMRLPFAATLMQKIGGRIELHLFDRGYLGLVCQEDGSVNACMAVRKSRLSDAGGDPAALFVQLADEMPFLADRLADMPPNPKIDAIGNVPYGWRAKETRSGMFRLGDQAAVIPSIAGEGVGIALASAQSAVNHWLASGAGGASSHQEQFARRVAQPIMLAGLLKGLGDRPALARALAAMPGAANIVARLTRVR